MYKIYINLVNVERKYYNLNEIINAFLPFMGLPRLFDFMHVAK